MFWKTERHPKIMAPAALAEPCRGWLWSCIDISSEADSAWTGPSFKLGIVSKSSRIIFLHRATGESTRDLHWKELKFIFRISVFNNLKEPFKCTYLGQEEQFNLNGPEPTPSHPSLWVMWLLLVLGSFCPKQPSFGGISRPRRVSHLPFFTLHC